MLHWNTRTKNLLQNKFFSDEEIKNGSGCYFFSLSKTTGAKLFYSKRNRDFAHKHQGIAYEKHVGPKVGDMFEIKFFHSISDGKWIWGNPKRRIIYGYLTQIAEPAGKVKRKEENELCDIVYGIKSLQLGDICLRNLGRIKGELVLIDFDLASHGGR